MQSSNLIAVVPGGMASRGSSKDSPTRRARCSRVTSDLTCPDAGREPGRPRITCLISWACWGRRAGPVAYVEGDRYPESKGQVRRAAQKAMDSVDHDLSTEQWSALKEAWGGSRTAVRPANRAARLCAGVVTRRPVHLRQHCASVRLVRCQRMQRQGDRVDAPQEARAARFLLRHAQVVADLTARSAPPTPAASNT